MAVDFATLVCLPCFQQFARPVTITPIASQLGAAPYVVRGDRSSRGVNLAFATPCLSCSCSLCSRCQRFAIASCLFSTTHGNAAM